MKDFARLWNAKYKTKGLDVDYSIQIDHTEKKVYLMFFGTNSKIDWKTNFKLPCKVYKNQKSCLRFHRGYIEAWKSCNDEIILEYSEKIIDWSYQPVIMGHSMGAALAILAAEDLHYKTGIKPIVITFGAVKMMGDKKTQKYITDIIHEDSCTINNRNDIVPLAIPFYYGMKKIVKFGRFNLNRFFFHIKEEHNSTYLYTYLCGNDF